MSENRRNSSSVILFIALMIVLFSFVHREKEKKFTESSFSPVVLSVANISGTQAIIAPATTIPEINSCPLNMMNGNFTFPECTSGREFIFENQLFRQFCSCRLKFLSDNPVIGVTFLQKIPDQEKNDDPLLTA